MAICRDCGRAFIPEAYDLVIMGDGPDIVGTRPDQGQCLICYLRQNSVRIRQEAEACAEQGKTVLCRFPSNRLFAHFVPLLEVFAHFIPDEEQMDFFSDN